MCKNILALSSGMLAIYYVFIFAFIIMNITIAKLSNAPVRFTTVYGVLPAIIVESPSAKDIGGVGGALACLVMLAPGYWDDQSTIQHELEHVRQAYRGLFIIDRFRYAFSMKFRLEAERDAFIAGDPTLANDPTFLAGMLKNYTDLTHAQIKNLVL